MTPDQLDRLQLAITNMVLLDDDQEPITPGQLQQANAADPIEAAEQRAKIAKLTAVVLEHTGVIALYKAAAKGFHISETSGLGDKFERHSRFRTMPDLFLFEAAWRTAMTAARDANT